MAQIKTHVTKDTVDSIASGIAEDAKRDDFLTLVQMMERVTGEPPAVWNSGVVGFGTYHYKSSRSSQEGDWFPVGVAARKANLTVYLGVSLAESESLLSKLGKYKPGKGCIYIKRLSDIDMTVLEKLVADTFERMTRGPFIMP